MKDIPPEIARNVARFGVKLAIDLLQTFYADLEGEQPAAQPKRRGRPKVKLEKPTVRQVRAAANSGWPADPEERRAEMLRRRAVAEQKKMHDQRSAAAKKRWDKMTEAQKAARLRAMERGKHAKVAA